MNKFDDELLIRLNAIDDPAEATIAIMANDIKLYRKALLKIKKAKSLAKIQSIVDQAWERAWIEEDKP